jgi:hypothetical protein
VNLSLLADPSSCNEEKNVALGWYLVLHIFKNKNVRGHIGQTW